MSTINVDNISKRTLNMAERRDIDLSVVEKEKTFAYEVFSEYTPADELVAKIEEIAHEHCNGDFSQIEVVANVSTSISTLYGQTGVDIDELNISLDYEREETDEEAARRFIKQLDKERK